MMDHDVIRALRAILEPFVEEPKTLNGATLDSRLRDDLNISSIHFIDILIEVEQQFGLSVSDAELNELRTLGQWVDLIVQRGTKPAAQPASPMTPCDTPN